MSFYKRNSQRIPIGPVYPNRVSELLLTTLQCDKPVLGISIEKFLEEHDIAGTSKLKAGQIAFLSEVTGQCVCCQTSVVSHMWHELHTRIGLPEIRDK